MLLISGATGNVGRPLVEALLDSGAKLRAVTRHAETADLPKDAEVVHGDFTAPSSLAHALAGVTTMFLNPAATGQSLNAVLGLAREHGVTRVVLLSSGLIRDDVDQQADPLAAWHKGLESEVIGSGLEWTFLRASEFAVNAVQQWAPQIRYTGVVREAYPDATSAMIHEHDVAAAAAQTLMSETHVGKTYLITGPESLTQTQMIDVLAKAISRSIPLEQIPRDAAVAAMTNNGLPQPIAESVLDLRAASVGHEAFRTSTVAELTGRPARTFTEWAVDHVGDFS